MLLLYAYLLPTEQFLVFIRGSLSKLQQKLDALFSKKGLSQYCTEMFCIKRHQNDDRTEWMVEFK
ncbi:MAG: hypothetical protein DRG59_12220 [Deltaproteobacteria bacterium]|nr:MAG: hypothetical protein DRG59_12220 [Deltaproteobacteria bacterium]